MTEITRDHVEWAMVGRLRLMLEDSPHKDFYVTQTYSQFMTILCWVVQRIRVRPHETITKQDKIARDLFRKVEGGGAASGVATLVHQLRERLDWRCSCRRQRSLRPPAQRRGRSLCQLKKSAAGLGVALLVSSASADEIKVLTTGILKGSFPQIAAQLESETGHKVTMSWGSSSARVLLMFDSAHLLRAKDDARPRLALGLKAAGPGSR